MSAKPKFVTVRVTRKLIAEGTPYTISLCPIARALHVRTNDPTWSCLGKRIRSDEHERRCSRQMKKFVDRFDGGKPVRPFSFRIPAKFVKK